MNKQAVEDKGQLTQKAPNGAQSRYSLRERKTEKQLPHYYGDYEFEHEENYRKRKSRRFKGNNLKKRKPMVGYDYVIGCKKYGLKL